nr:MAG TPA: SurA N-terminal domain [Caudoviricetes sp.]
MGIMQQFAGQNPLMSRAMQMGQGKSPEQMQTLVRNLAKQKGMNDEQLNQFLSQFGLRLQ